MSLTLGQLIKNIMLYTFRYSPLTLHSIEIYDYFLESLLEATEIPVILWQARMMELPGHANFIDQ